MTPGTAANRWRVLGALCRRVSRGSKDKEQLGVQFWGIVQIDDSTWRDPSFVFKGAFGYLILK